MATGIAVTGAGAIATGIVAGAAGTGVTGSRGPGLKKGIAIAIPFCYARTDRKEMAARADSRGHFANARDQYGRQRPAYQRKP